MPHPPFQANATQPLNAIVYIDYENILEILKFYSQDILEIHFLEKIQNHLKKSGLNIIDCIAYGNFSKNPSNIDPLTQFQSMGIQIRQTSNNFEDFGLTVEALRDLYEKSSIDIFVIISGNHEIIPLLKTIRHKNQRSFVITSQTGFNAIVIQYADHYEYLEGIFSLSPLAANEDPLETLINIDADTVSLLDIRRAKEMALYYYKSFIMKNASHGIQPVSLKLYIGAVARVFNRHPDEILYNFKLAHCLKYVTIYQDPEWGLCLKEGEKIGEVK
jgi:uncharacterized LabA/DUF88 family protein